MFKTPAASDRNIIHMDLDSFFVSVECLRDSRLKGKPLIIGHNSDRGVVASCSYEARHFGVHSAMPVKMALQLCPDAIVIGGDMDMYSKHSRIVTAIIAEQAPLFEKASIDEFYIDLSGMDRFYNAALWATDLRKKIINETGLPISMGHSINKMVSKVATGESKPNGQKKVGQGTEREFLAPLPVKKIPMIGKKTALFLHNMGITTVRTLSQMPVDMLKATFGKNGTILWNKANGIDHTPVIPYSEQKSVSKETTFENDTIDITMMRSVIVAMTEHLAFKLRQQKKLCACLAIKIRYANFDTEIKQTQIPYTSTEHTLIKIALELFEKLYQKRMRIRLVGIRLSNLVHGHYQINMFEDSEETIRLYQAIDKIRLKYGTDAVFRAISSNLQERIRRSNNLFQGET
jgi:DNA polymerase IV